MVNFNKSFVVKNISDGWLSTFKDSAQQLNISHQHTHLTAFLDMSWAHLLMSCENWKEPQQLIFQLANGCLFISCLVPDNTYGILVMHTSLILGLLLFSTWAWNVICIPDIFSWAFGFTFLNICHVIHGLYRIRPVRLDPELETVFRKLFRPLGINRLAFKKLVSPEYAQIFSLHQGEAYALQNLTRTDRLSLLLSGKAQVVSDRTTLHSVETNEFLDSPEFESSRATLEDKFRVSIFATSSCRYVSWQRSSLEYLFVKETHLANVFGVLVSRDVISKVYTMNKKLALQKGVIIDIRLPGIAHNNTVASSQENSPSDTSSELSTINNKSTPVYSNGLL